jgi:hypothetical protein
MMIGSGHISPLESLALVDEAMRRGLKTVLFQHPDSHSIGASRQEMRDFVAAGGTIEFCALGFMPAFQRLKIPDCVEIIRDVGAANVIVSTDSFFEWMPPAPELLRLVLGSLLFHGLTAEEAITIFRDNSRAALQLPAVATVGS